MNIVQIIKIALISLIISTILFVFIPTKETCKEMLVASVINKENVEAAKNDVIEIIDYIIEKSKE